MTIEASQATEFSTLLRQFRSRARLTQNELAGLSAVSARTIRNLEAGRAVCPRPGTVRLLADGLRLGAEAQARLSLAAGLSPVGAALHAAQGRLPDAALDRDPYGREHDLRLVLSHVHGDTSRMVSISGFGGVGKSRLAAALARAAARSRALWLWLGEQWHRELTDGPPDAAEELVRLVGEQPYLIIVDGADRQAATLESTLRELIRRCPRLTVVETARRPPREGGHVVPLKPLGLPAGSQVAGHPALRLLVPLVRAIQPDFQESAENLRHALDVCRSLDGLPRALETAATWFAFYSPAEVAAAAREDPGAVAEASHWLRDAVADALGAMTDVQRHLAAELAARTGSWTIGDLVGGARRSSAEIMASLRTLLALGVIRPADGADAGNRSYTVLNLVRHALVR